MDIETVEYVKFVRRALVAYGERVAEADDVDLTEMVKTLAGLDELVSMAARKQAERHSWTYVATALGMSRQGARQKYMAKNSTPDVGENAES